jgi:hypothetical protein
MNQELPQLALGDPKLGGRMEGGGLVVVMVGEEDALLAM